MFLRTFQAITLPGLRRWRSDMACYRQPQEEHTLAVLVGNLADRIFDTGIDVSCRRYLRLCPHA